MVWIATGSQIRKEIKNLFAREGIEQTRGHHRIRARFSRGDRISFEPLKVPRIEHIGHDLQGITVQVGDSTNHHLSIFRNELGRLILIADFLVRLRDGNQQILGLNRPPAPVRSGP